MIFHVQNKQNQKLMEASVIAEMVLRDANFLQTITDRPLSFTHTTDKPIWVSAKIRSGVLHNEIAVLEYKTWNPWSAAIGYSDGQDIYVNIRKIPSLSVLDYVGNFVHEFCHHIGYGHGNNSPKGKQNSVPYWCGTLAMKHGERFLNEQRRS